MTEVTVPHTCAQPVEEYVRFWNAGTEEERHRAAAAAFAEDVEYRAPIGLLSGTQALGDFRERFAGHLGAVEFRLRERPQTHHGRARIAWEILTGDGASFAMGTDILQFDTTGRISSVTVFLDRAPEGFDPEAQHAAAS
ncbi:nuclear transport factor 2 family protein [Streptomyces sp. NPDC059071]|uniref:nuclear transport factor 2 family protein n=1 Tax=unclassified Streptomyces TaxID=2593676 RepID=UPI00365E27F6